MKLLSWNIQWGRGVDGRVDFERIVAEMRRVAGGDAEVLMLQEVADGYPELEGSDGGNGFAALAALLPGYTVIAGVATDTPRAGGGRRRFGNLVASRLPVLQVFRHLLPWPVDAGLKSMQRIALEVNVAAPFGPLRVTTTHLEYYSAAQRRAQFERLRVLHREACVQASCPRAGTAADGPFAPLPRGRLALVAGDFNCRPDAPERRLLLGADSEHGETPALLDAWALLRGSEPHAPTVGVHDRAQWPDGECAFDFFFVGSDLAPRLQRIEADAASQASDHQPVWAELAD